MILAGVMLKLGTYGMLRFGVYLFPEAARWSRSLWLTLAVISGRISGADLIMTSDPSAPSFNALTTRFSGRMISV